MPWIVPAVSSILLVYLCSRLERLRRIVSSTRSYSASFVLLGVKSVFVVLLPWRIPFVSLGRNSLFEDGYTRYGRGIDAISYISLIPKIDITMFLGDAHAIRELALSARNGIFTKPIQFYRHFLFFGPNLLVSEGTLWKKYRKIIGPSFNERNNRLVWNETVRLGRELIEGKWEKASTVTVGDSKEVTFPLTLMVLMSAGFGVQSTWSNSEVPPDYRMSFQQALGVFVSGMIFKAVLPSWALNLTSKLRQVKVASNDVQRYMAEMIQERRHLDLEDRHDLLSNLLRAEHLGDTNERLSDEEILGNMFFLLVAGQDMSRNDCSHTLTCILALLAMYPEEQERLYLHIKSVIPDGRVPAYEDMPSLTYTLAVVYESLRLYAIIPGLPRDCQKDTTLPVQGPDGEIVPIPVLEGTGVIMDFLALHYNPSYWEDPYAFRPQRFMKDWPRDAFLPFSIGSRACLGRRFAETEMIAIVTLLVSRYRIKLKDDTNIVGETPEQKRARVLRLNLLVTGVPENVPLVFHKRDT